MKVAIIGADSELIRAKLNEISEQTGIVITEVMKAEIEGLLTDRPNVNEMEGLSIEMAKCSINESSWLDSHYQELKENKQEIIPKEYKEWMLKSFDWHAANMNLKQAIEGSL